MKESLMSISTNVSSLQANQMYMNANANNIANVNTDGFRPTQTTISNPTKGDIQANFTKVDDTGSAKSQTNLTKEIPDQIIISGVNEANINAIKTQNEMMGSLLDLKV